MFPASNNLRLPVMLAIALLVFTEFACGGGGGATNSGN